MKVSIITPVYNNKNCIADCIHSVLNQTYRNIEHIVVDGGSTDGTQQEIEPFKEKLGFFLSEKDSGIYDAMNKGIRKATGDIVGILNSDDFFYEPETVAKIVKAFKQTRVDLVYANGVFVSNKDVTKVKRIYSSTPFKKTYLNFGWIPLHPTIYVRKEVYNQYGLYDQNYSIASDYEISLRWFINENIQKYFLNEWVVRMRLGGISTSAKFQKKKSTEDLEIIQYYKLKGLFTLVLKIGRKVPQYLLPQLIGPQAVTRRKAIDHV